MPKLTDQLNMLSKATPNKVWNFGRLISAYYLSRWRKKTSLTAYPFSISIEPTTACNLGCPECPSGLRQFTRDTGNLNTDFFEKVLNQLSGKLLYMLFYFQGEPYINPNFLEMVKKASKKGIYTATSTNAHFLDKKNAERTVKSGLDRIIISIDGTTQEVYEQYRKRGSLEKVISGTKNLIEAKKKLKSKTPHIIYQFLVVRPNQHQIPEVKRLAKELGVDELRLKTAQVYSYENGNPLIPTIDKYSRYRKMADGTYTVKNKLLNQCWKMWSSCVITWDGKVVPCCFDKDATHQMGDLKKDDFKTVWNNPTYQEFRRKIMISRNEIDICKNCSEGTAVWK